MKIPIGNNGYVEPDDGKHSARFRFRIMHTEPIPNTRAGHYANLSCGHRVMIFGSLEAAGGRALCTVCRDRAEAPAK